ncbi:MAG: ATP-dependent zinc protease [Phycisphaeraceae bacterium]|nr:ATP-dependent zinc protease [Phycisphaeraceae bacterium]MCB9847160.1 ATP-dependent zinc protease [Phycisphaeraceae bacterium]
MSNALVIIGWKERVALPAWGIRRMVAKVDTGACVSAIHVDNIEELSGGRVRFDVVLKRDGTRTRTVEAPVVRVAKIKPSHGVAQQRYVVRTPVSLGGVTREVELSLVCRKRMRMRMLLGRKALAGVFGVDPSRAFVLGDPEVATRHEPAPNGNEA